MFTINARRLASVLSEFRRVVLGVGKRLTTQLVTFVTRGNCLKIQAKTKETVVAYETSLRQPRRDFDSETQRSQLYRSRPRYC